MKLSRTNEQKLMRFIWRDRLRKIAIGAAVAITLGGLAVTLYNYRLSHADPTLDVKAVDATVSRKDTARTGRSAFVFHARLSDGREVDAISPNGLAPPIGTRVVLGEARHQSGKLSYDLVRVVE